VIKGDQKGSRQVMDVSAQSRSFERPKREAMRLKGSARRFAKDQDCPEQLDSSSAS